MSDELFPAVGEGVRAVVPAVSHGCVSPDDAWLALALADAPTVLVLDLATGRVAARIPGAPVLGLGWTSPDALLVLRAQELGGRAVLHAMPDGAAMASVALPNLHGGAHAVSTAEGVTAVLPRRWHGGLAQRVRRRVGYVLRAAPLELLREVAPSEWSAVPSLPHARPAVAALEPDGASMLAWLGEPDAQGVVGQRPGHLVRYRWREHQALALARAGHDVAELLCCDPTRVMLREAAGDTLDARGDLCVVDLARAVVLSDTRGGDDALGPWATMDLDLDRERVLVAGRVMKGARAVGTLQVVDVPQGLARSRRVEVPTAAARAMGAVWRDDGEGVLVLTSPSASSLQVRAWRSLRDGPGDGPGWTLPLTGRSPARARLAWSPARTRLMCAWRATPTRGDAAARALGVTQLACIVSG